MNKNIENAKEENLKRYGQIYAEAFSGEPWNNPWKVEDATIHVKEILDSNQFYGLEYVIDDKVVGFLIGTSYLLHFGRIFDIDSLAVDPAYQHQGIGKALLKKCIEDMKKEGMAGVHLITESEGVLPEFYKHYGFKKEDELILMGKDL